MPYRTKLIGVADIVLEAYQNGAGIKDLAIVYGVSAGTVKNLLKRNGVPIRSQGRPKGKGIHIKGTPAYQRKYLYGLTQEEYNKLQQDQNGLCAICITRPANVVDHCHSTNKVRGLLCRQCNLGIGHLGDSTDTVAKALAYLERA